MNQNKFENTARNILLALVVIMTSMITIGLVTLVVSLVISAMEGRI